jgi:hypothetical protein
VPILCQLADRPGTADRSGILKHLCSASEGETAATLLSLANGNITPDTMTHNLALGERRLKSVVVNVLVPRF